MLTLFEADSIQITHVLSWKYDKIVTSSELAGLPL